MIQIIITSIEYLPNGPLIGQRMAASQSTRNSAMTVQNSKHGRAWHSWIRNFNDEWINAGECSANVALSYTFERQRMGQYSTVQFRLTAYMQITMHGAHGAVLRSSDLCGYGECEKRSIRVKANTSSFMSGLNTQRKSNRSGTKTRPGFTENSDLFKRMAPQYTI